MDESFGFCQNGLKVGYELNLLDSSRTVHSTLNDVVIELTRVIDMFPSLKHQLNICRMYNGVVTHVYTLKEAKRILKLNRL